MNVVLNRTVVVDSDLSIVTVDDRLTVSNITVTRLDQLFFILFLRLTGITE